MPHLILVRHGESELNALNQQRRVYCGQLDTPLTERGRQQARETGAALATSSEWRIQDAISSQHSRAVETLTGLLDMMPGPVRRWPASAGLNERSLGYFEGRSEAEVRELYPEYGPGGPLSHFDNHYVQKAPGGENFAEVTARAWPVVAALCAEAEADVLVVSHNATLRCILGRALQLAPEEVLNLRIPNAVPVILQRSALGTYRLLAGLRGCP